MKITEVLKRYNIPFKEFPEHHHCTENWINICCPFCGDENFKLGIHINCYAVSCWKCGNHKISKLFASLNIPLSIIHKLIPSGEKRRDRDKPKTLSWPDCVQPVSDEHLDYLERRNFDAKEIVRTWSLMGTRRIGFLRNRIIIPIFQNGIVVSYTSRDITGRSAIRYKNCPINLSIKPAKNCLYGIDKVVGDRIVVVEGPTDVWRLGPGAVATLGTEYTNAQVALMLRFQSVIVLYDREAEKEGQKLIRRLRWHNIDATQMTLDVKDPAELTNSEANQIMDIVFKKK